MDTPAETPCLSPPAAGPLNAVTWAVPEGGLVGLFGGPGAGKSALAAVLGLRRRPESGRVRVDGADAAALDPAGRRALRARIAFVDPDASLQPDRTAAGNIAAPLERAGVPGQQRRTRVAELLELVGLSRAAARPPGELGEGQRRRVALARALASDPRMVVIDELAAGLPAHEAGAVLASLDRAWAELGVTVVLTTADPGVVRRVCTHVATLEAGALTETGPVLDLLADAHSRLAGALLPELDRSQVPARGGEERVVDITLVGFATVGRIVPLACERFDVQVQTVAGGSTQVGETPFGRFRIAVAGAQAEEALRWLGEHGALLSEVPGAAGAPEGAVGERAPRVVAAAA